MQTSPLLIPDNYVEERSSIGSPVMFELGTAEFDDLEGFQLDAAVQVNLVEEIPPSEPVLFENVEIAQPIEEARNETKQQNQQQLLQNQETLNPGIIGRMITKVVGNKYCSARIPAKMPLIVRRDTDNIEYPNSVGVFNPNRLGYLPANIAAPIVQILDAGVTIEGICPRVGGATSWTKIYLTLKGPFRLLSLVQGHLDSAGLTLLDEEVSDMPSSKAGDTRKLFDEAMGQVDLSTLPLCPNPPERYLKVTLMKHQLQGLEWMRNREAISFSPDPNDFTCVDFWGKKSDSKFFNSITGQKQANVQLCRGGVLADDMGLGKTLTVISLILMDKHVGVEKGSAKKIRNDYSTLIVCPLSVLDNWREQIDSHVHFDDFTVHEYYGADGMEITPVLLSHHRVILTTYDTVSSNYNTSFKSTLFKVKFKRIILDEGHNIKTFSKGRAKSCYALEGEHRWLVSGTPITNSVSDFYSILKFLRFQPYDARKEFLSLNRHPDSSVFFRKLVQMLSLRRTKAAKINGVPIVDLKECTIVLKKLRFADAVTQQAYKEIEKECAWWVEGYLAEEGTVDLGVILTLLLRLRQYCDDPSLIPSDFIDSVKDRSKNNAAKALTELMEAADANNDECMICLDPLEFSSMVATECAHIFCRPCIEECLHSSKNCPACRAVIKKLIPPVVEKKPDTFLHSNSSYIQSSKVDYIAKTLKATPSSIKSIVFSQWTSMLKIIAKRLDFDGIEYAVYDGQMNRDDRDASISHFKKMDGPGVMLMSLKCGGVGLNIVEASQIFLCDPWWNTSIEQQAIDRCHRIGQSKPVTVFKLVIEETVEDRVLKIQSSKESMIAEMFSSIKGASQSKSTKEERERDLAYLFNVL